LEIRRLRPLAKDADEDERDDDLSKNEASGEHRSICEQSLWTRNLRKKEGQVGYIEQHDNG